MYTLLAGAASRQLTMEGWVEHQQANHDEADREGIARNQNVFHLLAHDAAAISHFLAPALARVDPDAPALQLLILTPDTEMAIAMAGVAARASGEAPVRVFPVTTARRATRLLAEQAPRAIAGSPAHILQLIQSATLKFDSVRTLVIAWADAMIDAGLTEAIEGIMAEVPKEASRTVVASAATPEVEALVERYARRPRRAGGSGAEWDEGEPLSARYVIVAPQSRPAALRRLMDDIDPARAAVYASSDETAAEVSAQIRALGYEGEHSPLVLTRGDAVPGASLVVLFELPPTPAALRALASPGTQIVALVTPRQQSTLRALCGTGRLTPYALSGPAASARVREEALRDEIRSALATGVPARDLLAIEPLLVEFDGIEIASAVLWLLERERAGERSVAAEVSAGSSVTVRVFVNAGTRDDVTARDLVGAIANEAGVAGNRIGKVELRDNHSLVEVPADLAQQVVLKLTGLTLRGRRLVARIDQGRPSEEQRPPYSGGQRGERGGSSDRARGGSSERGGFRRERDERGSRGGGGERGERRGGSERGGPRRDRDERGTRGGGGERSRTYGGESERRPTGSRPPRTPRPGSR